MFQIKCRRAEIPRLRAFSLTVVVFPSNKTDLSKTKTESKTKNTNCTVKILFYAANEIKRYAYSVWTGDLYGRRDMGRLSRKKQNVIYTKTIGHETVWKCRFVERIRTI